MRSSSDKPSTEQTYTSYKDLSSTSGSVANPKLDIHQNDTWRKKANQAEQSVIDYFSEMLDEFSDSISEDSKSVKDDLHSTKSDHLEKQLIYKDGSSGAGVITYTSIDAQVKGIDKVFEKQYPASSTSRAVESTRLKDINVSTLKPQTSVNKQRSRSAAAESSSKCNINIRRHSSEKRIRNSRETGLNELEKRIEPAISDRQKHRQRKCSSEYKIEVYKTTGTGQQKLPQIMTVEVANIEGNATLNQPVVKDHLKQKPLQDMILTKSSDDVVTETRPNDKSIKLVYSTMRGHDPQSKQFISLNPK